MSTTELQSPPPERSSPCRIAFCITDLDPGGAERALFEIVTRLNPHLFQPHVFSLSGGEVANWLIQRGIGVSCFDGGQRSRWQVFGWLARELKQFRPDIVQGFLFHGNLVSRVAGWRAGVPVRLAGHRVAEQGKSWHLWLDRFTKSLVMRHICVSSGVADHVVQRLRLDRSKTTVIPNGIDPALKVANDGRLRAELEIQTECQIMLAVGRLHRQKGFDLLIDAVSRIRNTDENLHLAIVGEGPERAALEAMVATRRCQNEVTLLGYRRDLPELMAGADLFVLSSRWEGMPNVVMQAMLSGIPVVAANVEGIEDLIVHEQSGLIVEKNNPEHLANALVRMLKDKELCQRLAGNAQTVIENQFTWEAAAQLYERVYLHLVNCSHEHYNDSAIIVPKTQEKS